jgi:hypothetical protein
VMQGRLEGAHAAQNVGVVALQHGRRGRRSGELVERAQHELGFNHDLCCGRPQLELGLAAGLAVAGAHARTLSLAACGSCGGARRCVRRRATLRARKSSDSAASASSREAGEVVPHELDDLDDARLGVRSRASSDIRTSPHVLGALGLSLGPATARLRTPGRVLRQCSPA